GSCTSTWTTSRRRSSPGRPSMACWGPRSRASVRAAVAAALLLAPAAAAAHAFPDHAEPRVGASVSPAPYAERIWFDGEIEPVFSTIRVENAAHERVVRGDGAVSPADRRLLAVPVPPLPPGRYRV